MDHGDDDDDDTEHENDADDGGHHGVVRANHLLHNSPPHSVQPNLLSGDHKQSVAFQGVHYKGRLAWENQTCMG